MLLRKLTFWQRQNLINVIVFTKRTCKKKRLIGFLETKTVSIYLFLLLKLFCFFYMKNTFFTNIVGNYPQEMLV